MSNGLPGVGVGGGGRPPPSASKLSGVQLPKNLRGSAQNLLELGGGEAPKACQVHENDRADIVIVCEPEGASLLMGGLHPRASLYEKPINLEMARRQHEGFRYLEPRELTMGGNIEGRQCSSPNYLIYIITNTHMTSY